MGSGAQRTVTFGFRTGYVFVFGYFLLGGKELGALSRDDVEDLAIEFLGLVQEIRQVLGAAAPVARYVRLAFVRAGYPGRGCDAGGGRRALLLGHRRLVSVFGSSSSGGDTPSYCS